MLEKYAVLAVRLLALTIILGGTWFLTAHVVQGWGQIDEVYWQLFLRSRVLPPAMAIVVGLIVWVLSRWLGRFLIKGLDQ